MNKQEINKKLILEIDELKKQLKEANDLIKDIASLLGEDDLGRDGKSRSIDDFKEAIFEGYNLSNN